MQFAKLTAAASLIATAIANPIASAAPTWSAAPAVEERNVLAKRAEGVHLVNCNDVYSAVVYCSNDSNCNFFPGSGNQCIPGGGIKHWEGSSQSCTFPGTGTTFTWNINSNAQSQANYAKVGSGSNGFHNFNIFKDDQHVMYSDGNGYQCRSIYYALDA